ncbi:MAG TPA: outer membrane lipoprotein-sorting protein [Thermoanaerobaculia bacterium]|nr:outer membrane lipoprotein-sorting protein [Thermoanaerobaculia bacterium]
MSPAAAAPPTAADRELLARSDVAAHAPDAFRARVRVRPLAGGAARELEIWKGEGGEALVRLLDPSQRGKFFLQRPEGLFLITPGTRQPVRLDPSHRLAGGVSLQEILGLRLGRDYELVDVRRHGSGAQAQAVLALTAKADGLPHARVRWVVRVADARPLRAELLLPSGKVARMLEFRDWGAGSRLAPRQLVVKDLLRGGQAFAVELLELAAAEPPPAIFALDGDAARAALGGTGG